MTRLGEGVINAVVDRGHVPAGLVGVEVAIYRIHPP